jgi:uncharacterized repeat protein (TIGR01451 family)
VVLLAAAFAALPTFVIAPPAAAAASADLAVLVTVNDSTPNVGNAVIFTVTVVNGGPATATNVSARDVIPAGLSLNFATASQGSYSSASGIWTIGTMNPSTLQTLQLNATVVAPTAQTDSAMIAAADQTDPNPSNNSASATETPQQADLGVTQSVDNATPHAGDTVAFTVTLTDAGPDQATNATVHDSLPAGFAFISATPSQGSYSSGTGVWTVGTVTTSTPETLTLQAVYNGPGRLINTALVSHADQFDPNQSNNSSNLTVPRTPTQTAVSSSADPSLAGQQVSFTATVTPAPDGGTVTFTVDGTPLGPPVAINTTTGTATSSVVSSFAVGSHQVVATYSGDANFLGSASPAVAQIVNRAPYRPAGGGGPPTALISGLRVSPSRFAAARNGPSAVPTTRRIAGASVTYALNEAATVTFMVVRVEPGRKGRHGRCIKPTKRNRHARTCTRLITVPGSFTLVARTGLDSFRFTGRVNGHKLVPGRYELIGTPSADGRAGQPLQATFKIVTR